MRMIVLEIGDISSQMMITQVKSGQITNTM